MNAEEIYRAMPEATPLDRARLHVFRPQTYIGSGVVERAKADASMAQAEALISIAASLETIVRALTPQEP